MIKVLIVEDDPMARQLLEIYLRESRVYEVIQSIECASLTEFCCRTEQIHLILMDICTAMNASGLDAAEKVKKHFPDIRIVMITSQPECSFLDRARKAGVDSFWYKNAAASELLDVMDRTMRGESVYPAETPTLQIGYARSNTFSTRELEVLRKLVAGETDAVIAEQLHISLRTAKSHIQSLLNKTGFRNRTELAVRARESGLIIVNQ